MKSSNDPPFVDYARRGDGRRLGAVHWGSLLGQVASVGLCTTVGGFVAYVSAIDYWRFVQGHGPDMAVPMLMFAGNVVATVVYCVIRGSRARASVFGVVGWPFVMGFCWGWVQIVVLSLSMR